MEYVVGHTSTAQMETISTNRVIYTVRGGWQASKEHRHKSHEALQLSKALPSKRFCKVMMNPQLLDEPDFLFITTDGRTATGSQKEGLSSQCTFAALGASLVEDYIAFRWANDEDVQPAGNTVLVIDD